MTPALAWQLCFVFGSASLLSFGGGSAIVPQLQLQTVIVHHWLTARQFADDFAIAQAAPGPSTLLVTLLGYSAGGLAGALVATAAMVVPAGVLIFVVARGWQKAGGARWRTALERAMAPIAVGLVLASGVVVARTTDRSIVQAALTAAATVVLSASGANPLFVVLSCGVAGWVLGA